ncbi:MAG: rod shape-determining protein MreD [Candidatus Omnitrophica bacterium]|nr:rod shape-determining protein MreD [Candidatus Omnitrophota bacterium]
MRQILIIPILCYIFQLMEYCLFTLFGRWGDPHLMLLLVIFFNLYSGIRFSLLVAICGGILKDCFSTMPFGTHIFSYMVCACLSTFIRKHWYERGSPVSKLMMVFMLTMAHTLIMAFVFKMVFEDIRMFDVFAGIWLPEMITTMVVALFVFEKLIALARRFKL